MMRASQDWSWEAEVEAEAAAEGGRVWPVRIKYCTYNIYSTVRTRYNDLVYSDILAIAI